MNANSAEIHRIETIKQLEFEQGLEAQRAFREKYHRLHVERIIRDRKKPWWKRLLFGSVSFWAITGLATTILVNEYGQIVGKFDWPKDRIVIVPVPTGILMPQATPRPGPTPAPSTPRPQ